MEQIVVLTVAFAVITLVALGLQGAFPSPEEAGQTTYRRLRAFALVATAVNQIVTATCIAGLHDQVPLVVLAVAVNAGAMFLLYFRRQEEGAP